MRPLDFPNAVSRRRFDPRESGMGLLIDELRTCCRTPQGHDLLSDSSDRSLFEADENAVRTRLRETTEARVLLDREAIPPLGGCADLGISLTHAEKGGVLEPAQLMDVRRTLEAIHATLGVRDQIRPRLA